MTERMDFLTLLSGSPLRFVDAKSCSWECDICVKPLLRAKSFEGSCSAIAIAICCFFEVAGILAPFLYESFKTESNVGSDCITRARLASAAFLAAQDHPAAPLVLVPPRRCHQVPQVQESRRPEVA